MDVPPVGDVETNGAETSRARLLGGDDLSCLQVHHGRSCVIGRDQREEALTLAERLKGLEHRVVAVVRSDKSFALEDVNVAGSPVPRKLAGFDARGETLSWRWK